MQIDGERISIDGFHGGRDRTFGVRVADEINFWLWLDAGFEDRAIEAWVIESHDGTVQYVDGGITHVDGTLSKRFVKIEHDVEFDGDQQAARPRRPRVHRRRGGEPMTIPASVDEVTPTWLSEALDADIARGRGGRRPLGHDRPGQGPHRRRRRDLPETLFVKLQPFDDEQRDVPAR